jgi:ribonuclease BN (tRNA processing enzyme)
MAEQGFLCSMGLQTNRKGMQPADAAADPPADEDDHAVEVDDFSASQKNLEIVGPQHLSQFLRTALLCSDTHLPWNYHVTELLPAGSSVPALAQLHDNEAAPTFIFPDADGTYTVLTGHPSGITVRAATLTHRVFCLGYALTEPQRPGK